MKRFLVPDLAEGRDLPLPPTAAHHALHVCRLPTGAEVVVFDGVGAQARARLDAEGATVRLLEAPHPAVPSWTVHLVLALLKGDAMAHALRMATEAGVTHVHPVVAHRSVARGDHADRWHRILASAAQQCGRADCPAIAQVQPLAGPQRELPRQMPCYVAAPGADPSTDPRGGGAIAVGPEGGWLPSEVTAFVDAGWRPLALGEWVLRADTAAAVAVSRLARS